MSTSVLNEIESHQGAFTAAQLAALLGVSKATVFRRVPGFRLGVSVRYCPKVVAAYLRARGVL